MAASPASSAPFSVTGKTAIITGAGSGINLSLATLLLQKGCNIVIADLSLRPEAEALVSAHTTTAPRAVFHTTNVTLWPSLTSLFDRAESEFGGFDILIPGAGVFEPWSSNFWHPPGSAESRDPADGEPGAGGLGHYATLDINLTHPIRATQMAIVRWLNPPKKFTPGVEKVSVNNPKRIVHISSIAGQVPGFSHPLYAASKHALNGFVWSLGPLEEKLGVRVNCVAPGVIKTPLWTTEKLRMLDQEKDVWVEPEEVALAMVRCIESEECGGGTVWEVTKARTRKVHWIGDPGPSGEGATSSNRSVAWDEVFDWLGGERWGLPAAPEIEAAEIVKEN